MNTNVDCNNEGNFVALAFVVGVVMLAVIIFFLAFAGEIVTLKHRVRDLEGRVEVLGEK